jgi:hypothetical protein
VNAPASDHNLSVFLLKAFASPTIKDMNLSRSSGADLIVVSPFMPCRESGKGAL